MELDFCFMQVKREKIYRKINSNVKDISNSRNYFFVLFKRRKRKQKKRKKKNALKRLRRKLYPHIHN